MGLCNVAVKRRKKRRKSKKSSPLGCESITEVEAEAEERPWWE